MVVFSQPPLAEWPNAARLKNGKLDFTSGANGQYQASLAQVRNDFKQWLKSTASPAQVIREYDTVLNGVAVQLNGASLDSLKGGPGVTLVEQSLLYHPNMNRSVSLINAASAWTAVNGVANAGAGIKVGVIDTGIDGTHPDIAPNFDRALSRNFTTDIPVDANGTEVDGPCEHPSCVDPVDEDDNEHGTHVASTIASPLNGLGIAGVAPGVTLVNVRAGQDSGFFFLQPVVDALTYSADHGIDVVNMSFYTDPWLFNCTDNPADSPENQAEQRTIIQASERALAYAHRHGVTLVAAAGNGATDYTKTIVDDSSPDYPSVPGEAPYERTIPPSCISEPSEGQNVIAVSALGISTRKSYYSDYGNGYVAVSAPGGDSYDTADGKADVTHAILAAYPKSLAVARGELNADGTPNVPYVVRSCKGSTCAYYQYLQGTSMASPHTVGVVALIVSRYGQRDRAHGGLTLSPARVESILEGTATEHACPTPRAFTYTRQVLQPDGTYRTVTATHTCEGPKSHNGFYGHGIVDALGAVSH
jgi:subtilisin family serine protease